MITELFSLKVLQGVPLERRTIRFPLERDHEAFSAKSWDASYLSLKVYFYKYVTCNFLTVMLAVLPEVPFANAVGA